eukprot:TRINITY_DN2297_c0_g1_i1.p1 TRINITY_DN2297_c0_g1~~TRINITY_DN2297_c0_g1_i1.p1  ORF type:complete len:198 (+),score=30.25 TRINITY_DN2297_c0_g1_i1:64-594(+)
MSRIGKVKSWSDEKGYGFICPPEGQRDIFVHRKVIGMQSSLIPGKEVRYDFQMEEGNPKATRVLGDGVIKRQLHHGGGGGAFPPMNSYGRHVQLGIVKSWASDKGYGFISQGADGSGGDLFVLNTQTRGPLIPNAKVTYTIGLNPKTQKPWAENVVIIDQPSLYGGYDSFNAPYYR